MAFGADLDGWSGQGGLTLVEKKKAQTFLGVSWGEMKLLLIAGVGFLMDAWDLFIINLIYSIILVAYYPKGTKNIDWGLEGGVLKAAANIGNIVGQVFFGFCGDMFGRSAVYGKELVIVIVAVILQISAPDSIGGHGITIWLAVFRFIMGIGIGGDYPMSASVVSDRAHIRNRGFLLSWIFSNQGWGNLTGALFGVIVIAGYRHYVDSGDLHKLSGAWRILQGLTLVPAFITIYFRLTLVESTRFTQARRLQDDPELVGKINSSNAAAAGSHSDSEEDEDVVKEKKLESTPPSIASDENQAVGLGFKSIGKPKNEFIEYFSEWKHFKNLFGCAACWFLVDITFYGINLNQSSILAAIGFTTGTTWGKLMKTATGNLIITAAGFLPGYFITMFTIDIIGRKKIQLLGFTMNALFLGILAGRFNHLKNQTGPFFVVFVFLQLFFNFGANATTFIVPAEVFPTRVRATAHGVCAACGKCGAILSSLLFAHLASKTKVGNEGVFWIFFGVSVLGIIVTWFFVPETMGYDADEVDRQELAAKNRQ
ncbi:MFS general substrate transporter [Violaceomyces palustris]|uniref:MFS general substrate transporter n=1 Tax=Violaceomyces palustris TaxID=1673888 RepID=A0ACD0NQD9_9BASI|nr:MFS general substrate transporter [Violaceomyces palustris]